MIWLALIVWIIFIFLNAFIDAKRNNKGKSILFKYHLASWMIRYGVAFLIIFYIWYLGNVPYKREVIGVFLSFGAIAWLEFDPVYNKIRNLPLDYVGETSWLDQFFHHFDDPFKVQMIIKFALLIWGFLLYFI